MRENHQKIPPIPARLINNLAAVTVSLASIPSANAPTVAPVQAPNSSAPPPATPTLVRTAPPKEQLPHWVNEVTSGRQEVNLAAATLPPIGIFAVLGTDTLAEVRGSPPRAPSSLVWEESLSMAAHSGSELGKQRDAITRLQDLERDGLINHGLVQLIGALMLKQPGSHLFGVDGSSNAPRAPWHPLPKDMPPWLIRTTTSGEVAALVDTVRTFRASKTGTRFDNGTVQSLVSLGFLAGGERREGGVEGVKEFLSGLEQNKVRTVSDIAAHYLSTAAIGVARLTEQGGLELSNLIPPSERQSIVGTPGRWLNKLATGTLVSSDPGYCVTAVLETMEANWVPNPAATGKDPLNNPRGLASQLINHFGWRSLEIEGVGKKEWLKSPIYGDFNAHIMSVEEFARSVDQGKIPTGAVVFQTRHPSWNGNSVDSLGFDASIAVNRGVHLWNGRWNDRRIYGPSTRWVFVLVPGEVDGQG